MKPAFPWLAAMSCAVAAAAEPPVQFTRDLLPVLRRNCLACHNATKAKADLNLETPASMRTGGENGPAAVPGKSAESLVFKAAAHQLEDSVMPPRNNKVNAADLTAGELSLLGRWIDQGAVDDSASGPVVPIPVFRPAPIGPGGVTAVAFSATGRRLAAARAGCVDLYDPATGAHLAQLIEPSSAAAPSTPRCHAIHAIAFSRDGLVASGGFRTVNLWRGESDPLDPATSATLELETATTLQSLCTQRLQTATERAKTEQTAATAAAATRARTHAQWLQNPADPAVARAHRDARTNLEVATRLAGQAAATVSAAQTAVASAEARLREARAAQQAAPTEALPPCGPPQPWKRVRTLGKIDDPSVLADRVTALDFSPDGLRLATGGGIPSREGEIKIWDTTSGALLVTVRKPPSDAINALEFSPDGLFLATASADRSLRVWDAQDGTLVASFEGHAGAVLGVAWRADGQFLATAGADRTLRVWDLAEKKQIRSIANWSREVSAAAFIGGGDTVFAASGDSSVRLGDQSLPDSSGFVLCGAADPTARFVAAGTHDGTVRWWSVKDRKLIAQIRPDSETP